MYIRLKDYISLTSFTKNSEQWWLAEQEVRGSIPGLAVTISEIGYFLLPSRDWLAEQEVRGSIPGLAVTISEIGYFLLPSRDMAERSLKRRKSSTTTNQKLKLFYYYLYIHVYCIHIHLYEAPFYYLIHILYKKFDFFI